MTEIKGLMIEEVPQMESSTYTVIHKMLTKSCISKYVLYTS